MSLVDDLAKIYHDAATHSAAAELDRLGESMIATVLRQRVEGTRQIRDTTPIGQHMLFLGMDNGRAGAFRILTQHRENPGWSQ